MQLMKFVVSDTVVNDATIHAKM